MKKAYQSPNTKIFKIAPMLMNAASPESIGTGDYAGGVIQSRRGRMDRTWDDFVDEED